MAAERVASARQVGQSPADDGVSAKLQVPSSRPAVAAIAWIASRVPLK